MGGWLLFKIFSSRANPLAARIALRNGGVDNLPLAAGEFEFAVVTSNDPRRPLP